MQGDIHFYSGDDWFSKAIKFFTRSEYTHVAIEAGDFLWAKLVFESYYSQGLHRIGNPVRSFRIKTNIADHLNQLREMFKKYDKKDYGWGVFFRKG